MGQKIFFLSLIILALAMGMDYYKNLPKTPKRPKGQPPATTVNLDDLQVNASSTAASQAPETASSPETATETVAENASEPATASTTTEPEIASGSSGIDPIIEAWKKIKRSPFEPSPFRKLMEDAKIVTSVGVDGKTSMVKKSTQQLAAPFTATIETEKELLAVVNRKLYKKGDDYEGRRILKIEKNLISVEDASATYLIPKTGVKVFIASDGTYDLDDEFMRQFGGK